MHISVHEMLFSTSFHFPSHRLRLSASDELIQIFISYGFMNFDRFVNGEEEIGGQSREPRQDVD